MAMPKVVDITSQTGATPRENLTNHIARIYEVQQKTLKVST